MTRRATLTEGKPAELEPKAATIMSGHNLFERRAKIETQWGRFVSGTTPSNDSAVNDAILSSWQRSAKALKKLTNAAPVDDAYTLKHHWARSPIQTAVQTQRDAMAQLVDEGSMVAAIADPSGKLLWTSASNYMRTKAESVNFQAGARWDEQSVGTNAVGLSLKLARPVTVFSCEHYLPSVHDWVCYAAPIIHPRTNECVGILDMSTTWKRHSPLGQAAVYGLAHAISSSLPEIRPRAELEIFALGQPTVTFRGNTLNLTPRQIEILCLLALNPEGLSLNRFHAVLYGDAKVSTHTLKSELSHLRRLLDGKIGSRPYRLETPLWADFLEIWKALHQKKSQKALGLYRGPLVPHSNSPELEEWRHCIDAVMAKSLDNLDQPSQLIGQLNNPTHSSELIRLRLSDLLNES